MPGRQQIPSFQLASGTTNERDNSYNISNTLGSIFYNTDTSNVEIRHEDPSNTLGGRDLVMNNKEQIDISGKLVVIGNVGIGTTTPTAKLEVKGSGQDLIYIKKSTSSGGVGIKFTDQPSSVRNGFLRYYHEDALSFGVDNYFRFSTTEDDETVAMGGALHIGVDGKEHISIENKKKGLFKTY